MSLSDRQQLALETLAGSLCVDVYVLKGWSAWRSLRSDRAERAQRSAEVAAKLGAVKCIRRRLRRHV